MKKIIIIIIIAVIIVTAIWTSLTIYVKENNNDETLKEKVTQELLYLNQYLITMLGEFNGLNIGDNRLQETEPKIQTNINTNLSEQTDEKEEEDNNIKQNDKVETKTDTTQNTILRNNGKYEPKWEKIETEVEQIYQVWNTMSIDLYSLNIDNNLILSFNDGLNKATQAIKNRDKASAVNEIALLQEKTLNYKKQYNNESRENDLLLIQTNAVLAYSYVTNEEWNNASSEIENAKKIFSNLLNSLTNDYTNQATMSQCYILINELKKAIDLKDKEIFFIEYRNLMSKMEIFF